MKKRFISKFAMLALTGFALFSCGGNNNQDANENDSHHNQQPEAKVLESITVKEDFKILNLKEGDTFFIDGDVYTCLPKGLSAKERKVKISILNGEDEFIRDEDGIYRCIGIGEANISITSVLHPEIKDTMKVIVSEAFFTRELGNPSAFDLTDEMPTETKGGKVISDGQVSELYFKNGQSTKWYAETEITLNSVMDGEIFPKFGLVSYNTKRDPDNIFNRVIFFLNAEIGKEGVTQFDKYGVCEVRNAEGYAWCAGINDATARHKDDLYVSTDKVTYGTKFKLGFARDGLRYYTWVNNQYAGCFDILEDLIPADVPSCVGLFEFNSNVTYENYFTITDSTKVDEKISTIGEDLKMITTWTEDDCN